MIISDQNEVTVAVLEAMEKTPDPRLREIVTLMIKHLHGFIREARLSEEEFQQACNFIVRIGQKSNASHNEAVLMAGSLGVSSLVCLLNNGNKGQTETSASMLGPFWRLESPHTENGGSIVRSATPGPVLFVNGSIVDSKGAPIADAIIDVWQSSPEGLYENQDPSQADMNLRGQFRSDANGKFRFRSVMPAGYPIPVDGPVGDFIRAVKRPHNYRPAHVHFLIYKPGFKTLISQIYVNDDPLLETDVQFGVTKALIGNYVRHENEPAPEADVKGPWYSLDYTFAMENGEAKLPRAPITGKQVADVPSPAMAK
ncbi:dioxygenase [Pseudorhodoplanes sinuspersici]|uniref:Catechol 1,2-dioxygenase n=1 Tax=Pseudorhodoplanes sinuspersici TaxID=1235591 RepID=A0A1W6ZVW9_9HYPH|nr:dioxygenase [Pseudorhodoplanes sinuspersici]ARQ01456.1 catechol 1,2-dioxygenase [Pseudorhodoplanes sinuspersici]RKE73147.1 catechol 1,2-dioxygenase [Pseudorhodoplanes sinuspersici]